MVEQEAVNFKVLGSNPSRGANIWISSGYILRHNDMTADNWIDVGRIVVDLLKTVIPFTILLGILLFYKKEIKALIKNGGFKISAPGLSVETLQKQQEKVGPKEKKEIESLNEELKNAKQIEQKLKELQEYTARDKDTFFLGYHFEKTHRLIFPTQMAILNFMVNHNGEIEEALAEALFRQTIWAQKFNVAFVQFIGFLMQAGLIFYDKTNKKFTLAPVGNAFWEYLKNENMPLKLPANDFNEAPSV